MNKHTIQVFKKRDFGELISTPITFLVREFKQIFITLLVFVGPLIVLNLILARITGDVFAQDLTGILRYGRYGNPFEYYTGGMVLMTVISIFETIVLYTVLAVYVKLYKIHGSGGFQLQDILNEFLKRIGQTALAMFVAFIMMLVGFFVFLIPGIYLAVVFYIFCAVIVFEEIPFGPAFSRVFEVMKGNWWMTFGTFIILAIIAGILNFIISAVLSGLFVAFGYTSTVMIAGSVVTGFISLLITSVIGLLPVFLYTSFVDDKEKPELMSRIDKISDDDDVNIFDLKESGSEGAQNNEKEKTDPDDEETKPKIQDEWEQMLDEEEKKNRFDDDDDEDIDRFKPKY